jgi:hypothetical protein
VTEDDYDDLAVPLTDAQRVRFEAVAERALAQRRRDLRQRRTIWKGRRAGVVWHIYRPTSPTKFGRASLRRGRVSFSLRWIIGWVLW